MSKTILVPLDGSPSAESILPTASRLARHTGATLILLQVIGPSSEYWPAVLSPYPGVAHAAVSTERAETLHYLEKVAASDILDGIGIRTLVHVGSPAPTILDVANSYHADLILLCHRRTTSFFHRIMGRVIEQVIRHTEVPVLVIREGDPAIDRSTPEISPFLRALVPLDGSTHAKAALAPAAEWLAALAAPGQRTVLHLARVVPPPLVNEKNELYVLQRSRSLSRAKRYLSQMIDLLRDGFLTPLIAEYHITISWSVACDSDIAGALLRIVENGEDTEGAGVFGGCDFIALATHGRGGLQRLRMGSVTERILKDTRCPVLVVHPTKVAEPQPVHPVASGRAER